MKVSEMQKKLGVIDIGYSPIIGYHSSEDMKNHFKKYTHSKQVDKKILFFYMKKIFTIVPYDIPICCQIFYHSWLNFKKEIPEYAEKMNRLSKNAGIIYCPDCITKKLGITY